MTLPGFFPISHRNIEEAGLSASMPKEAVACLAEGIKFLNEAQQYGFTDDELDFIINCDISTAWAAMAEARTKLNGEL